MRADYAMLAQTIASLTEGEDDEVALMATVACELHHSDDRFDWTGFYRVVAPGLLKIGPYQGGHGCLSIPFSRGVCGAAARTGKTQRVDDVHAVPDHIACDAASRSELVVPLFRGDTLVGVFDLDSPDPARFDVVDQEGLEEIARMYVQTLS
jgi:GAF domain-containing protein